MYIDASSATGLPYYGYATGGLSRAWTYYNGVTSDWIVDNGGEHLVVQSNGNIGIGTTSPLVPLGVEGGTDVNISSGGYLTLGNPTGTNLTLDNNEVMCRNGAGAGAILYLNHEGGDVYIGQGAGTGRLKTPVLEITGGSDLSESFDVFSDGQILPGFVVSIDPDRPGGLEVSHRSYDRRVAGVVSGAGDVRTGMVMGQRGSIADGSHPVALTGRVYVWCTGEETGIEPGDLLTTSEVRGHAMPVRDHGRSDGAVIGKAMTSLAASERGLVLVLVNLQ